jgi:predicted metal-dependent phosphotriesterase family hydrolase
VPEFADGQMRDEGKAVTVLGPVSPDELGLALTHEHIFIDGRKYFRKPDDPIAAAELAGPVTSK